MKLYLLLFFLFVLSSLLLPQDTVRIYLLSNDIGITLDPSERDQYKLLPKLTGEFHSALFFKYKDNFFILSRTVENDSLVDSVSVFSYGLFLSMAGRIQYAEHQKMDEDFNPAEPAISYLDTVMAIQKLPGVNSAIVYREIVPDSVKFLQDKHSLPLGKGNVDIRDALRNEWEFYLGGGLAYNTTGLELNNLFNAYEEVWSLTVQHSNEDYNPGGLISFASNVIFRKFFFIDTRVSSSTRENFDYTSFQFMLGGRYEILKNLYPFLAAGYSLMSYSISKNYNISLANGGFLESIDVDGKHSGWKIAAGTFYDLGDNVSLNFFIGYSFMKDIQDSKTPAGYNNTVNASGFDTAITIMLR